MSHEKADARNSSSHSGICMKDILDLIYTGDLRGRVQSASVDRQPKNVRGYSGGRTLSDEPAVQSASVDRQPKNARGYIGGRTLSDEPAATRVTKTSALALKRREAFSKAFVSSERDLLSRRATASGVKAGPALAQSNSMPQPMGKRGKQTKPSPLTVEDSQVQEMHRDLMRIFREGVASKTIVPVASCSPLAHHEKLSPRLGMAGASERPSRAEGMLAVLIQIEVVLMSICWGVLILPVKMVKAVMSDQPPWCDPSPHSPGRPAPKLTSSLSGSSSVWQTMFDVLDSFTEDWTPS